MELQLITDEPKTCQWGEITEKHTLALEKVIQTQPSYWLWSHKRWKREIPSDIDTLKQLQKEKFNARFMRD